MAVDDPEEEFVRSREHPAQTSIPRDVLRVGNAEDQAARRDGRRDRERAGDRPDDRYRDKVNADGGDEGRDDDPRDVRRRGRNARSSDRGGDDGGGRTRPREDDRAERKERFNGGNRDGKRANEDEDRKTEKDKSDGGSDDDAEAERKRKKRRPLIIGVVAVVALLMVGGGLYYWLSTRDKISTDDAFTDGNIVLIAPQVAGQVVSLDVTDNQFVRKGDPLIHIDARQYVYSQEQAQGQLDATKAQAAGQKLGVEISKKNFPAALELAKANLAQAQATLVLQQANYDRQKSLPKLATTQQDVDTNAANFQQAKAQVAQAEARVVQATPVQQNIEQSQQQVSQIQGQIEQAQGRLDQAKLNVEWSVVRAPQDGWVTRRNVNAGDYLTAGQQIMSLVTTDVWVTANYKETQLDGMHPGQTVEITVDAYTNLKLRGRVESIQRGSGSRFSAFPTENATGNFIKIVQRVPVKIVIESGTKPDEPLPIGVSVVPTVLLK